MKIKAYNPIFRGLHASSDNDFKILIVIGPDGVGKTPLVNLLTKVAHGSHLIRGALCQSRKVVQDPRKETEHPYLKAAQEIALWSKMRGGMYVYDRFPIPDHEVYSFLSPTGVVHAHLEGYEEPLRKAMSTFDLKILLVLHRDSDPIGPDDKFGPKEAREVRSRYLAMQYSGLQGLPLFVIEREDWWTDDHARMILQAMWPEVTILKK